MLKIKELSTQFCIDFILTVIVFSFMPIFAFANSTSGTIDASNRYAWSENAGWIDFGTNAGAVTVNDSVLTGYAYGENIGWISLNCSNTNSCGSNTYAVTNNSEGHLSGYAWSENAGWISFAPSSGGVTISSSGVFTGSAYSENLGWINFTGDHPVTTDWRPYSIRTQSGGSGGSGGYASPSFISTSVVPLASTTASTSNPPKITSPKAIPNVTSQTYNFKRDFSIGSVGIDVKNLQIYLNTHGFVVAIRGNGSMGQESLYFGPLTKDALAKFQKANNIKPSLGFFGPITRAFIINKK